MAHPYDGLLNFLESTIMIDHVSIGTRELSRATAFYNACFAPLGYCVQHQDAGQVIYGADGTRFL
jgi:catechol 2,3-dioxygenase-like lactoylglutathione lyase family enzyme